MLLSQFLAFFDLFLGKSILSILEFFEVSLVESVSFAEEGGFLGNVGLEAVFFIVH